MTGLRKTHVPEFQSESGKIFKIVTVIIVVLVAGAAGALYLGIGSL